MSPVAPGLMSDDPDGVVSALKSGSAENALKAMMSAIRTKPGRGMITDVLSRRLGGPLERVKKQAELKRLIPGEQPLFVELIGSITLDTAQDAANEMVRILGGAVERGTSDQLLSRALGAIIISLTDPGAPQMRAAPAQARSGPASAPQDVSPRAEVTGKPSNKAAPKAFGAQDVFDPDGPFRIPDRVVRFGEYGAMLAAPLFQPLTQGARGPGPFRVPASLPGPPETSDPDLIRGWLRGRPAFSDTIGVRSGLLDEGDPGDLMELEAEFHSDPTGALRIYKAGSPIRDGTPDAAWCARLGRDIGRFGVTHEKGVEAFAEALTRHPSMALAERLAPLIQNGSVLIVHEELAEAVCGLIDAQADYLEDGPGDVAGRDQNLLGSFSPEADLSRGLCLDRALTLHLVSAVPLGSAMRQSLTEFRIAQALRANPNIPITLADERFERDPAMPLAELSGLAPIERIGWSEPALV